MKPLITESQKREIEALAEEHSDALIAMGSDLYRQGLIKGGCIALLGVIAGATITTIKNVISTKKKNRNKIINA